jgi:hypothetical protein
MQVNVYFLERLENREEQALDATCSVSCSPLKMRQCWARGSGGLESQVAQLAALVGQLKDSRASATHPNPPMPPPLRAGGGENDAGVSESRWVLPRARPGSRATRGHRTWRSSPCTGLWRGLSASTRSWKGICEVRGSLTPKLRRRSSSTCLSSFGRVPVDRLGGLQAAIESMIEYDAFSSKPRLHYVEYDLWVH